MNKADRIASFGYGIYTVRGGVFDSLATIAVADPLAGSDGYYLEVRSIDEAFAEMLLAGLLDGVEGEL